MNYIGVIKNLWSNRRYRSLIILGIYALFFTFTFMIIGQKNDGVDIDNLKGIDLFKTITEYHYRIEGEESFDVIVDDNIVIQYKENNYDLNNVPLELEKYDFNIYNPNIISKIIDNATLESTNYINSSNTYIIEELKFYQLTYNQNISSYNYIKISSFLENENIIKVEIIFPTYKLLLEVGRKE